MLKLHQNYNQVVTSTATKIKTQEIYISLYQFGTLHLTHPSSNFENFCNYFNTHSDWYCGIEFSLDVQYAKYIKEKNNKYLSSLSILAVRVDKLLIGGNTIEWITVDTMEEFFALTNLITYYKKNNDKLISAIIEKTKQTYNQQSR